MPTGPKDRNPERPKETGRFGPPGSGINWLLIVAFVVLTVLLVQALGTSAYQEVSHAEVKSYIERGLVERVEIGSTQLVVYPLEGAEDDAGEALAPMRAVRVAADESLVPLLEEHGVDYRGLADPGCTGGLMMLLFLPVLLLIAFWIFMFRRMGPQGHAMGFGKVKARLYAEEGIKVTFDDVAGVDEAREELEEVVEFLRNPERFHRLGARIPRGVMLVGPPGTGKTLIARAVAGEAGVTFFSISGSDFVEMFVGVGAARVRDLFEQAKEKAPCIIFLDELDAVGKVRGGGGPMGGNDEREQTLNALLVEMDGFDDRAGVIVLAATNRPETLDPALLRPGRFDRQVLVDRPDRNGRCAILRIHLRRIVAVEDVDVEDLAQQTTGFVGADLANVVNEAALLAARRGAEAVAMADFRHAIERVIAGLEKKNRRMNPIEKEIVAYHENGHAIVARALPTSDPVRRISIVPRGMGALGYTLQVPLDDRYLLTRRELVDRICGLLGGRAAEEVVFGEVSTGAKNDLQRVSEIARRMMTEFGMSEAIGLVHHGATQRPMFLESPEGHGGAGYSDETARLIDAEVRELVAYCHDRARRILLHNRTLLETMSRRLMEDEVLEDEVLDAFLSQVMPLPEDEEWAREHRAGKVPVSDVAGAEGSVPPNAPPAGPVTPGRLTEQGSGDR
ncbi:MAG: ATP-dependent metallopeptidase FtsH/Yme1/Tma family protein [Deltaproteobacteria bacterium]|nr:MAG: ATP-dependent metallopeptidase FtsH/Yme1/Tma family protein [Deltaproteobacteria bacterium]